MSNKKPLSFKNKKASFNYELIEKYVAGIVLQGTEIKSIRDRKVAFNDAYCVFLNGELYLRDFHIAQYSHGNIYNHEPTRERKLLLKSKELEKLESKSKNVGLTIVPTKLFVNDKGFAKMEIALAKGKKQFDKRENLKEKDAKRQIDRVKRNYKA